MFNDAHIMASGMRIKLQTTITNAKNPARFQAYIPKQFWTEEQKKIAKDLKDKKDANKQLVHMQLCSGITAPQTSLCEP